MQELGLKAKTIKVSDLNKLRLINIINKIDQVKVLVIGDLILDEYLLAKPERISREAPVMIFKYIRSKFALGGAANAAANLATSGAKVDLIGVTGLDGSAVTFKSLCEEFGINLLAVVDEERETTTKTRIISTSNSNPDSGTVLQQQVLRVDRENSDEIREDQVMEILGLLSKQVAEADAILISDYSNGVLTNELISALMKIHDKKTIVDSNGDIYKFKGAYSFTPNQPDTEKALGLNIKDENDLANAGLEFKNQLQAQELLITRGAKGMALFGEGSLDLIPAFNLSEVFDVTGAGDTVAAWYTAALAAGATALEAAILGNLAASIVVAKYGTATTNKEELIELLSGL